MDCVMCKGRLIEGKVNHIVDIDNHIIIIKNVPANICSQCGEYYLENLVAIKIEELLENVLNNNAEVLILNYINAA